MKNMAFLVVQSLFRSAIVAMPIFWVAWFRKTAIIYGRTVVIIFMRLVAMATGLPARWIMIMWVREVAWVIHTIEGVVAGVR